jgi:hypothetical protein
MSRAFSCFPFFLSFFLLPSFLPSFLPRVLLLLLSLFPSFVRFISFIFFFFPFFNELPDPRALYRGGGKQEHPTFGTEQCRGTVVVAASRERRGAAKNV